MKLSIIICVYNTPPSYLEECFDSIRRSTVGSLGDELEICMVDDGSDIDYSELTEKYGVRVQKTENRGIFSARMTGAKMAKGEYSIYCDSDDTVSFNYYLPMVEKAISTGSDVVINDWATHTSRAKYYAKDDDTIKNDIDVSGDDTLLSFVSQDGRQHSFFVLWNKLYKTELLLSAFDNLLRGGFNARSSYSEDAALNFFIWRDAGRIVNIHTGYYFYRIHPTQTVTVTSKEKLKSQIDSMTDTFGMMRRNIGENKHKDSILRHIDAWSHLMCRSHYSFAKSGNYNDLFPYIKEKYNVKELRSSTVRDGAKYESKRLLGENFNEVDRALLSIYKSETPVRCKYCKRDGYVARAVEYLRSLGKITFDASADELVIPKFRISFKNRLIHNKLLQRIASFFFKKGSRAREFLKKYL